MISSWPTILCSHTCWAMGNSVMKSESLLAHSLVDLLDTFLVWLSTTLHAYRIWCICMRVLAIPTTAIGHHWYFAQQQLQPLLSGRGPQLKTTYRLLPQLKQFQYYWFHESCHLYDVMNINVPWPCWWNSQRKKNLDLDFNLSKIDIRKIRFIESLWLISVSRTAEIRSSSWNGEAKSCTPICRQNKKGWAENSSFDEISKFVEFLELTFVGSERMNVHRVRHSSIALSITMWFFYNTSILV